MRMVVRLAGAARPALAAFAAMAVVGAAPADAGTGPISTAVWAADKRIPLEVTAGSALTVLIGTGERVLAVSVSDAAVVEAAVTTGNDGVIVRTLRPSSDAWVSVRSDARSYEFALIDTASASPAYVVEVSVPGVPATTQHESSAWKIRGERALRPASISDDGVHTYISWAPDQLIPAVFALNMVGDEEMVDGYMRGDVFTIDRVHQRLVFRIDRRSASARRERRGKRR